MLPTFELHRPAELREALELIHEEAVPYCGGTELLLAMKVGLLRPRALVDLKSVGELRGIAGEGPVLRIGAAVCHDAVASSPLVRTRLPVLADVALHVGNPRVRAQGTVGGNLCFAEPKSDLAPILIGMDASVELAASTGTRTLSVADFIEGPYWTAREDRELLTAISIPADVPATYLKYQTMERPTLGVAVTRLESAYRIVVGAACEVPAVFDVPSLDLDGADLAAEVEFIADLTGSEEYKRHVTGVYIRRAIARFREEHERV